MSQNIIDTGQAANDGTGEPLRQAFTAINNNFSQIWTSGPVNSNIQIANNRIATLQTNQDLVLVPNGIGNVQANATVVPSVGNTYDLGSSNRRWDTVWAQYLDISGPTTFNNLNVDGNLTVQGNIIEIGNIVTDSKTIQLANTAANTSAANGSGITVGANDNIATLLYSSTSNTWTMNIGANITGNVTAPYFIGNGSLLTGLAPPYSNANVVNLMANFGSNTINTTGNISAPDGDGSILINVSGNIGAAAGFNYDRTSNTMFAETGSFAGNPDTGVQGLYVGRGSYTILGSPILAQLTSDIDSYSQINLQNVNTGNFASGDYIITADNGTDSTYYLDLGLAGSNHADPDFFGDVASTNDGYLYIAGSDEAGPSTGGPGNLILGSTNGVVKVFVGNTAQANVVATVASDGLSLAGNIVPTTSNVYSLGNSTNQWSDLYVSNATIYMNSVPISLTAGNVLTVNGEALLSNDSNTSISTTGNITADYFFGDGSQLTGLNTNKILNGTSNVEIATANGNITITANGMYTWSFEDTGTLNFPAGPASIFGGMDNDFTINTSNSNAATYTFTFSQFGDLTVPINLNVSGNVYAADIIGPGNGNVAITANTQSWLFDTNGVVTLPSEGQIRSVSNTGMRLSAGASDATGLLLDNTGDAEIYAASNVSIYTDAGNTGWTFGTDSSTIFPTLTVTRGDRTGTLTGQTLLFGDSTQEAIISTPNGTSDINSSQRLVINPGAGYTGTTGEGGDIYLYAGRGGDAGGSGGDIKIRGGLGPVDGDGGYLDIMGGEAAGNGTGGRIDIQGGQSANAAGGPVQIYGGQGITGGDANITGGVGTAGSGGAVRLTGGTSANGLPEYGNIYVQSGVNTWTFDNTGNLTIVHGSKIREVASPIPGNYALALAGTGQVSPDQQLLVYPTSLDANHLHLTSGNLYNTELFLGNDNLYVKLANTGNVVVNTDDGVGNTAQWNFDTFGNLTVPDTTTITAAAEITLVANSDGNISGLIINGDAAANLYAHTNVVIYTNSSGTGNTWTFDNVGNFTAPGNLSAAGNVTGNYILGNGSELTNLPAPTVAQDITSVGDMSIMTYDGNIKYVNYATVEPATGTIKSSGNISAIGNVSAGNFIGSGSNVDIVAGAYDWTFDNTGNLTLPTNAFTVNYANGTAVSLGGSYSNADVATFLAAYGSNTISTTGNVTAGNVIGNISITGNVTGTSPNVTLVAGSFSTVFDNTGKATFPGPMQLAVYDNTTVRDSQITSPQPGMVIYVTGTGMQVRGATSWNTIAGSGT